MTYERGARPRTTDNYFRIIVVYYYTGDKIYTNDEKATGMRKVVIFLANTYTGNTLIYIQTNTRVRLTSYFYF